MEKKTVSGRKFRSYLLESFMIFIAVVLGFFAESLRESLNDSQREREYIQSLISNLQLDTMRLSEAISENQRKIAELEKIISLQSQSLKSVAARQELHRRSGYITFYSAFQSNDATMLQLKAGGLQYIKRSHVADSIAFYDQLVRSIYKAEVPYSAANAETMRALTELLQLTATEDNLNTISLLTTNDRQVDIFFNKVWMERAWTENYVQTMQKFCLTRLVSSTS